MTTKQYVKKYRLGNAEYSNRFNTDLFLRDLNEEFRDRLAREEKYRKGIQQTLEFRMFQRIIMEIQQKFMAISNKKAGGPLRRELWNAFYAKYIISARAELFPAEHEEIRVRRLEAQRDQLMNQYKTEMIQKLGDEFLKLKELGGPTYKKVLNEINAEARERAEMEIPI